MNEWFRFDVQAKHIDKDYLKERINPLLEELGKDLLEHLDRACPLPYRERILLKYKHYDNWIQCWCWPEHFGAPSTGDPCAIVKAGDYGHCTGHAIWERLFGVLLMRRQWLRDFLKGAFRQGLVLLDPQDPLLEQARDLLYYATDQEETFITDTNLFFVWPEYSYYVHSGNAFPILVGLVYGSRMVSDYVGVLLPQPMIDMVYFHCKRRASRRKAKPMLLKGLYPRLLKVPYAVPADEITRFLDPRFLWNVDSTGWQKSLLSFDKAMMAKLMSFAGLDESGKEVCNGRVS